MAATGGGRCKEPGLIRIDLLQAKDFPAARLDIVALFLSAWPEYIDLHSRCGVGQGYRDPVIAAGLVTLVGKNPVGRAGPGVGRLEEVSSGNARPTLLRLRKLVPH